jgi:hypothetical protein
MLVYEIVSTSSTEFVEEIDFVIILDLETALT